VSGTDSAASPLAPHGHQPIALIHELHPHAFTCRVVALYCRSSLPPPPLLIRQGVGGLLHLLCRVLHRRFLRYEGLRHPQSSACRTTGLGHPEGGGEAEGAVDLGAMATCARNRGRRRQAEGIGVRTPRRRRGAIARSPTSGARSIQARTLSTQANCCDLHLTPATAAAAK
jgi:hypothetical protein